MAYIAFSQLTLDIENLPVQYRFTPESMVEYALVLGH